MEIVETMIFLRVEICMIKGSYVYIMDSINRKVRDLINYRIIKMHEFPNPRIFLQFFYYTITRCFVPIDFQT